MDVPMTALEALLTRRSIRKYIDREVPDELVADLLRAAMAAPSAGNQQPWRFVVIRDRALLDRIPEFHKYSLMCREASCAVLVCGDPTVERYKGYWVQDCSAATQNLLLAARALGLGAVWCGIYPEMDRVAGFRSLCGLPEHVIPLALVPLGWPAEEKGPSNRYNEAWVSLDTWGKPWPTGGK